jgi:hypothetical protein
MFFDFEKMLDELMLVLTCYSQVPISSSIRLTIAVLRALMSKNFNAGKRAGKDKLIESVPPSHIIFSDRQVIFAPPFVSSSPLPTKATSSIHVLHTRHPEAFQHITRLIMWASSRTLWVFLWLFSAFAGWLEVEQMLLFWDRHHVAA